MIQHKKTFISSIGLFVVCLVLSFILPKGSAPGVNTVLMSFPIQNVEGPLWAGVVGAITLMLAFILLLTSLTKYRLRAFFIAVIGYIYLPILVTTLYQETFAKGVSAISYDGSGVCAFDHVEANEKDDVLNGTCSLTLYNRSKDAVTVELSFVDDPIHKKDVRFESLMNEAGPYTFTLEGNSKETIRLNELLDVSGIKNRVDSGTSNNVHIKLIDGEKERIL